MVHVRRDLEASDDHAVESVLAFVIGSVGGVLVGFWFARQPRVAAVFDPYVKMINALPRVVLAPIFALWLGWASGPRSRSA
jgi:ABC-type nitrate/sulfonate/bicarbonate transport system permease component